MRLLHTSDWHLGKSLEGYSRIEEQKMFIDEIENICNDENIDLIIIAGDIYDTVNPSAEAEKLFYSAVKRLSNEGRRPIIVIAGNHDSPSRLTTSKPLAEEFGIILLGTPKSIADKGKYKFFSIEDSGEGYIELKLGPENIVILTMPYPSEKSLNEIICDSLDEKEFQKSYSDKIKEIFSNLKDKFRENTINAITGHFYITGGQSSSSERNIQLGGSYAVNYDVFPENVQYIAMGHLHRPQKIARHKNGYYSGSPIEYSKSEAGNEKCVFIADLKPNEECKLKKVKLTNYKPIEIWKCSSIEMALNKCRENENKNCWVFLEIDSDKIISQSEIKELHSIKSDIVEIEVNIQNKLENKNDIDFEEKTIEELFREFYTYENNIEPTKEIVELFLKIANDIYGDDDIETNKYNN